MNCYSKFRRLLFVSLLFCISGLNGKALSYENAIFIPPLFEYPVAPESLPDLQTKSDWLMEHFWDAMDFKNPNCVDQSALNDAMNVYGAAAMYASRKKTKASVDNLINNVKGNPSLMLQFTKAAEEVFYGRRAVAWIDELYIPFLKAILSEKKISNERKERYGDLLSMLRRNAVGEKLKETRLTLRNGQHRDLKPEGTFTLIEFGNPDCDDCKFARMKLEMASDLMDMVENKELQIMFIVADSMPDEESEILEMLKSYPEKWVAGISYGGDDIYDIRHTPSFYIINEKGVIIAKNLDVNDAVNTIRNLVHLKGGKVKNK